MYRDGGRLILSPTDLTNHLECGHLSAVELAVALGGPRPPVDADPTAELLRARGEEHERAYLARLQEQGLDVVEIAPPDRGLDALRAAAEQTIAAMRAGAPVVYQGAFFDGTWRGHADFLHRVERPSDLGAWSYEPYDTKLAHRAKPAAILQLCCYAEQLARIQGVEPEHLVVVTGRGEQVRLRYEHFAAYSRRAKATFERAATGEGFPGTYPVPVPHCRVCDWNDTCTGRRRTDDHLSLVAGMRSRQVARLTEAGIPTVEALANATAVAVDGIGPPVLDRLRRQAALQVQERRSGTRHHELLDATEPGRGLAELPAPSPGDVFFDMEGDPFVGDGGIEYLFGLLTDSADDPHFTPFWGHDADAERVAFEATVDFLIDRLERHPDMHVYHYAPYEQHALHKLTGRHATREREVDRLLRAAVFVDLYAVVKRSVLVSSESYSIKELEPLYMPKRTGAITDAGSSVVGYERYLDTGDQSILDAIEHYNRDDCVSTLLLRDWLEARRPEYEATFGSSPTRPTAKDGIEPDDVGAELEEAAALADALLAPVTDRTAAEEVAVRRLLADLLLYHRREARAEWFWFFRRRSLDLDSLFHDHASISGLELVADLGPVDRSVCFRYRFDPTQPFRCDVGDKPVDPATEKPVGTVVRIEPDQGLVEIKRSKASIGPDGAHPTALIPPPPIPTTAQRDALRRIARAVVEHGTDPPRYRAALQLLRRDPPRASRSAGGPLVAPGESALDAARRNVASLDGACLAIQGPPGTGKTFSGAQLIVDLVRRGQRVGITALSHKAIGNLLDRVVERAAEQAVPLRAMQKAKPEDASPLPEVTVTDSNDAVHEALAAGEVDVVAGTTWLFCREQFDTTLDYLFVDEAAQLALANVVAASTAATNLVLLGDPQQLTQPSQGDHPEGSDTSALAHLLGNHDTIPPDLGLFLDTTYRMHPAVCAYVSELAYDQRLRTAPGCERQEVLDPGRFGGAGLRWEPVAHHDNSSSSPEEAARVAEIVDALLGVPWRDRHDVVRPLAPTDLLVVAPFNAHVALLSRALPDGVAVGTVDKFQGREAAVVIYSMASSTAHDAPRGVDFLYDRHRFNVAISRARALAVVVASPELLAGLGHTPEQMRLVNALCRFAEIDPRT